MPYVTLVVPPGKYVTGLGYERYVHTPLESVTALRSVLIEAGHHVQVCDYRSYSHSTALARISSDVSPSSDIVGFTCFFDSFLFIEQAISALKQIGSKATMIVGGPTPSAVPDVFLHEANADVVALGEAEGFVVALVEAPRQDDRYAQIPGIAWKSRGSTIASDSFCFSSSLDELPRCDWSYADRSKGISAMYSAGRGCSGSCTFCARKLGPKRFRSPARFAEDLAYIREFTGETFILFHDSDFVHENPFLEQYCSILRKRSWEWSCLTSPCDLTPDQLEYLFECGCRNIRVGIEAHDEEMIRQHRVGFDLAEMNHVLDVLEACPIPQVTGYYVLGLPDQTLGSLDMILREATRRRRIVPRSFQLLPLPGAAVFQTAIERELIKDLPAYLRSLESVRIDEVSTDVPNLSACSYSMLSEVRRELTGLALERIGRSGVVAFP